MALLDRVKERIETDLGDAELSALIAEGRAEIELRYGPDRDTGTPLVLAKSGARKTIDLNRPIDAGETVTITEGTDTAEVTLTAADYEITNAGRTVERIGQIWDADMSISYVPVDDQPQRDEATIKLVQLSIAFQGVDQQDVGDVSTDHADFYRERERILAGIAPRKGLIVS